MCDSPGLGLNFKDGFAHNVTKNLLFCSCLLIGGSFFT